MTALVRTLRSTAFRLTFAIFGFGSIGAALVLGLVAVQVIKLVDSETRTAISAEAAALVEQYESGGLRRLGLTLAERARAPAGSIYLLTDSVGEPLVGNISQLPPDMTPKSGFGETRYQSLDGVSKRRALVRIYALPNGFRLLIGHDLGDRARIAAVMVRTLALSLVLFAALAALGALFVARRVLRRIDAMNVSARTLMAGHLAERLPVDGSGDELDRLAVGLNQMLARIGELMAGLSEVSDNIAHDLRTPLTRLRNHAEEVLRLDGDKEAMRVALLRTIEESDGLIKVFDALLLIARAEAGADRSSLSCVDVSEVVDSVAELYEPLAEEKGFVFHVDCERGLVIEGRRELIGQALANLLDNALKYGALANAADPREIAVGARREGAEIVIEVADRGPGVAPEDRERVFDRFVRLENARSRPGSGLGLSLVAAAARLHGGAVKLEDNAPGLKVRLSLPAPTP
ncbi:MAG TPA: ATP-binding protein [Roseiarcus sp.]|nr:ATP-binding protein [Roseiarcus sp.]